MVTAAAVVPAGLPKRIYIVIQAALPAPALHQIQALIAHASQNTPRSDFDFVGDTREKEGINTDAAREWVDTKTDSLAAHGRSWLFM